VLVSTIAAMTVEGQGRIDDAITRYERILEKSPNAVVAANNLAWIYADRGVKLDEAQRLAQRAATAAPKDPRIADTVGWVYYKRNLPLLAIPQFERSIAAEPENPEFHYHLGLALAQSGSGAKARQSLERALKIQPDFKGSAEARKLLASMK
jgi:tetratricopeptide (TPR) repeat protein